MSKASLVRRGALVAVLALAIWAVVALLRPPATDTVVAERRDVVSVLAVVGRVRAPSRAALGTPIAGVVDEVRVREGDAVEGGEILVTLDARETRAAVREAEAALAEVRAGTSQAIEEAEREARQAARDLERIRSVRAAGGLTPQRVEEAEQRAADAASRLASLRAAVTGESGQPASVVRAQATVDAARARLAQTRVTAPADGVVLTRSVEPGDAVAPGRVLLEMAFDGAAELVVFPGEENLSGLTVGAPATASADAFPNQTFEAFVALIAPSVDPTQGTVEVRLTVPAPPAHLRPDMTVSVNIETGRSTAALVLPDEAVHGLGMGDPWVGLIRDGRLVRQPVNVGLQAAGYVEIVSGLDAGQPVARTLEGLEPGDRVRTPDPARE